MKKLLLLIATCALFTTVQEIHAEGAYAGLTGGLNWLEDISHHQSEADFNTGCTGAGVLGYRWDSGLRLEGELAYRYNGISKVKYLGQNLHLHGNVHTWSTMANVLYSLPVDFYLKPYVGAGIGYAKSTLEIEHKPSHLSTSGSIDGFTHQFIAGVEYPLNDYLSLDTKYRYQKLHHADHNQSVEAGLVYAF